MKFSDFFTTFSAFLLITQVNSIMWELDPNTRKCLKDNIQGNVAVTGEYHVSLAPGQRVDYVVSFSKLFQKEVGNLNYLFF